MVAKPIRRKVFLVEDHAVVRESYTALIELTPDLQVCGAAATAEDALDKIPGCNPDLVIVDVSLPGMDGVQLIRILHTEDAHPLMLVVSGHQEALYVNAALSAGAHGYLGKDDAPSELVDAIRGVLNGERYLSKSIQDPAID